jgi:hypothetical protein
MLQVAHHCDGDTIHGANLFAYGEYVEESLRGDVRPCHRPRSQAAPTHTWRLARRRPAPDAASQSNQHRRSSLAPSPPTFRPRFHARMLRVHVAHTAAQALRGGRERALCARVLGSKNICATHLPRNIDVNMSDLFESDERVSVFRVVRQIEDSLCKMSLVK